MNKIVISYILSFSFNPKPLITSRLKVFIFILNPKEQKENRLSA
jgi:hypothetical protein